MANQDQHHDRTSYEAINEERTDVSIILEGALVIVLAGSAAIIVALAVKLFRGAGDRASRSEDARIIQELYQGLSRLEERVESLETILTERSRKERNE